MFERFLKYRGTAAILALLLLLNLYGCGQGSVAEPPSLTATQAPIETQAPSQAAELSGRLEMHVLDVGQADSIFILLPTGQTMLIDAGNPKDGATVAGYLEAEGVARIDYLIGTHPHADHIGGMPSVLERYEIGAVYLPALDAGFKKSKTYESMEAQIKRKNVPVLTAEGGITVIEKENLKAAFVAPNSGKYTSENNYSAVLRITYGDTTFLLTGDAERESEAEMLSKGYDLEADVLKVGHHGSDTSSSPEFIAKVKPKYAIISVGKGNSYGHPADATLATLGGFVDGLYRTDENGTVVITSDGVDITLERIGTVIQPNAPPDIPKAEPEVVPDNSESKANAVVVYITNSGAKYHRDGCRYLNKSRIETTLTAAKAKGYTPCSVCKPQ